MSEAREITALIVDDEPLAREGIRAHLEAAGGFRVIGESANGRAAVADIRARKPDVVFLDVQMPGMSGFDVVDAVGLDGMPITVFITAYDAHALKAFEAHAVDYLLKPIDPKRFRQMADRLRGLVRGESAPQRLVLRDRQRSIVLAPTDIDWIEADGDYVRVYAAGKGHLVRHTIGALEQRLDGRQFARIHRSSIVNIARIREVQPDGDRSFRVVLKDGTRLRMSRGYRDRLQLGE